MSVACDEQMVVVCDVGGILRSPAPLPPLIQGWPLSAQRRIVTVAGEIRVWPS